MVFEGAGGSAKAARQTRQGPSLRAQADAHRAAKGTRADRAATLLPRAQAIHGQHEASTARMVRAASRNGFQPVAGFPAAKARREAASGRVKRLSSLAGGAGHSDTRGHHDLKTGGWYTGD